MADQRKISSFFSTAQRFTPQTSSRSNPALDQENVVQPSSSSSVISRGADKSALIRLNDDNTGDTTNPPKRRLVYMEGDKAVEYMLPDGIESVILNNGVKVELGNLLVSESQTPEGSQEDTSSDFKPPVGLLGSVFNALKEHLDYGKKGEKDSNFDSSSDYMEIMRLLPSNGISTLKSKGKSTPIRHNGNEVFIKWQDETLWYNEQTTAKKSKWDSALKKCKGCWSQAADKKSALCANHSAKLREFILVRNKDEKIFSIIHPSLRMATFNDEIVNQYLKLTVDQTKSEMFLRQYIASRPANNPANFTIDTKWAFENSTPEYQTNSVSLALLVLLHNMKVDNNSEKIHLKMQLIHFEKADWSRVLKIINRNGVEFVVGDKDESVNVKKSPMLPKNFSNTSPYTYQGWDSQGGCYDGLSLATIKYFKAVGSDSHTIQVKTGMTGIKVENRVYVYQSQVQHPIDYEDETLEDEEEETFEDEDSWSEMKKRAKHAEFLGFVATLIATMMKIERDGHVIHPLTQILPYFNEVFNINLLLDLFKFKTQRVLEIKQTKALKIVDGKLNVVWED